MSSGGLAFTVHCRPQPLAICLLLVLWLSASEVSADVQPGDVIRPSSAERVRNVVSPGVFWCVERGLPMRRIASRSFEWPPAYKEATEKYASQVRLTSDGLHLEGYVAGAPFPHLDANDPQIANKLIWNFNYKFYNGDDFDLRNFDADTGSITADREFAIERHFLIAHFRRLWYVNRLYIDPKPNLVPNTEEIAYKETLHPLIEPFDLKGVGFTYYRYLDPARQDDSWLYLPTLRRVRRLSTAQCSTHSSARSSIKTATTGTADSRPGRTGDSSARRRCSRCGRHRISRRNGSCARLTGHSTRCGRNACLRRRGGMETSAVRVLQTGPGHRQGALWDSVRGYVRPGG